MIPTREEALKLLNEAEPLNPGAWVDHCRYAAKIAEIIADKCPGMDKEKAYVLGLLHDIGRRFGVKHLGHVYDGWRYMNELGYDEVARICLTHSFVCFDLKDYVGRFDITEEQIEELRTALAAAVPDDYDYLIQLADSLAGSKGVMDMEERMADVRRRYGRYEQHCWDRNLELRRIFEAKTGHADLYALLLELPTEKLSNT